MKTIVIIAAVLAVAGVASAVASHTVRGWISAVWYKWFKDSEVNFFSDLMTFAGMVGEFAGDPTVAAMFEAAHISPLWLLGIGLVVRALRMLRAPQMIPLTSSGPQ